MTFVWYVRPEYYYRYYLNIVYYHWKTRGNPDVIYLNKKNPKKQHSNIWRITLETTLA